MGDTQRVANVRTRAGSHGSCVRLALATAIACAVMGSVVLGQSPPPGQTKARPGPLIAVGLGARVELTLRDAIQRALRDNLDLRVERYLLELGDLRVLEARGAYNPLAGFSLAKLSSATPTTSVLQAGGIATETAASQTFGATIAQLLPTGGSVTANLPTTRASTNNAFSFVNPLFSSDLTIGFEQPLLRGLFSNPTKRQLSILNLDSRITESEFRQVVAEIVLRVEEQYLERGLLRCGTQGSRRIA